MKFFVVASLAFYHHLQWMSLGRHDPDIVTRSALPTVSCTDKPLKIVTDTKGASSGMAAPTGSDSGSAPMYTPTQVPVSGASANKMGGAGMAVAAAVAAVYLL
ncbi:hypothetical protein FCULG_00000294 [Fusarium culmorum]|uniref:Uncharacterized protein n=1 Tax=Fusarium culmorum TaxID=5516 RepID=A0A2T4GMT2_FUSCU|nr:hypothetical protein FCULG_00000294 [Fusarium culmorum]